MSRPNFTDWLRSHHNVYQASRTHMDCAYAKLMQYELEEQENNARTPKK